MNTSQLSRAELIAGIGGLVLLISLFFPWYGVGPFSVDAWEAFDIVDLLLFLCAIVAVGSIAARATGRAAALPVPTSTAVLAAGAVALLLVVYRLINVPGEGGVDRELGIFVALLAAAAVAYGGKELNDREGGGEYTPPVR